MQKQFYLQDLKRYGYNIWQPTETFEQYGQQVTRCLLVADDRYPIVSQEDAPLTALFSNAAMEEFIPVNS